MIVENKPLLWYIIIPNGAVAQFGSASEWHSEGRGFDPHQLHSFHLKK